MSVNTEATGPQVLIGDLFDPELPSPLPSTWYTKVRAMRLDPTIALARQLAIAPVLAAPWQVESNDEAPEGAVDFIDREMQAIRIHLLRTAFLGFIDFGWQGYEKVFTTDGVEITVKKLKPLLQDFTSILVDVKTGAFAGLKQNDVELKTPDCLLLNINVEGTNWYGEALLKPSEKPYDKWEEIEKAAVRYDKKVAGVHWVIHYPPGHSVVDGTTTDNFTVARNMLAQLQASGGIIVPRSVEDFIDAMNKDAPDAWKIELMGDTGGARAAFLDREKYLDALKVRGLGLPERSVLEGEFGTKAEAEAHGNFAILNMELRHQSTLQDVNWHLVNQLLRLNYGEDVENSVWISPAPLSDPIRGVLRDIYTTILASPEGFIQLLETIDLEALQDALHIPVKGPNEDGYDDGNYLSDPAPS